jgi:hypothetical protein
MSPDTDGQRVEGSKAETKTPVVESHTERGETMIT